MPEQFDSYPKTIPVPEPPLEPGQGKPKKTMPMKFFIPIVILGIAALTWWGKIPNIFEKEPGILTIIKQGQNISFLLDGKPAPEISVVKISPEKIAILGLNDRYALNTFTRFDTSMVEFPAKLFIIETKKAK